jgi:hypothetical protein
VQQNATLPYPDADLRDHPPRPARARLGGISFLPRTIDKTRAKIQDTLGPYKILPGISGYLFEWLGLTEEQFTAVVLDAQNDDDIVAWLYAHTDSGTYAGLNEMLENRKIRDAEHRAQVLPAYPILNDHPELWNWFEIFDLDDAWMYDEANRGKPGAAPKR